MAPPQPFVQIQGMGAVSADQLDTFVQTVINYAQLRTFVGLTNMVVQVQGGASPGDGGQGLYWYNAGSTAADNGSTVIVPTGNVGSGAWLQIPIGTLVNLTIAGTLSVGGATTLASTLAVAGVSTFASDIIMSGAGEIQVAAGTTAQRSATPTLGMLRYNTSLNYLETFGTGGWAPVSGASASGIFPGDISGLLPSTIAGTSTTATLTIATGKAVDSTAVNVLNLAIAASWAVTNGAAINGFRGGTTLPNSSTIHFFICSGTAGTGTWADTSLTPTLPTGYGVYFRRIFSLATTSGGAPIPFTADEVGGGSMLAYLTTPTFDINAATLTTANRTLYSMNVPGGVKMQWLGNFIGGVSADANVILTSPDETDTAPGSVGTGAAFDWAYAGTSGSTFVTATRRILLTNTGGQIGIRASVTTTGDAETFGWIDFRRT